MQKENKIFIFTGGEVKADLLPLFLTFPRENDIIIAADSGYDLCLKLNLVPHIFIGDMDSTAEQYKSFKGEILLSPCEKDDSDTMLAIKHALKISKSDIVIIGGLSGRADHTLSNIFALEYIYNRGRSGIFTDGQNRITYHKGEQNTQSKSKMPIEILKSEFTYFSLIAADKACRGIRITGCKYPLENAVLYREEQYVISNEITSDSAFISVREGSFFIIESR